MRDVGGYSKYRCGERKAKAMIMMVSTVCERIEGTGIVWIMQRTKMREIYKALLAVHRSPSTDPQ